MKYLYIYTPFGDKYIVDIESGNITKRRWNEEPLFSGSWKFLGFIHVKHNEFISLEAIRKNPAILDKMNLKYKNGNPQYTVVDLDYGTRRTWGNTKVHGVSSISIQ